tara:strand:+ start:240 stop:428 length:189 start_codon:yes stop_codon:yes gene_type:complete
LKGNKMTNTELEELKSDIYQTISDVYKSWHGYRPRFDYKSMTLSELEAERERLIGEFRVEAE